jgi:hypothetical protein
VGPVGLPSIFPPLYLIQLYQTIQRSRIFGNRNAANERE